MTTTLLDVQQDDTSGIASAPQAAFGNRRDVFRIYGRRIGRMAERQACLSDGRRWHMIERSSSGVDRRLVDAYSSTSAGTPRDRIYNIWMEACRSSRGTESMVSWKQYDECFRGTQGGAV